MYFKISLNMGTNWVFLSTCRVHGLILEGQCHVETADRISRSKNVTVSLATLFKEPNPNTSHLFLLVQSCWCLLLSSLQKWLWCNAFFLPAPPSPSALCETRGMMSGYVCFFCEVRRMLHLANSCVYVDNITSISPQFLYLYGRRVHRGGSHNKN